MSKQNEKLKMCAFSPEYCKSSYIFGRHRILTYTIDYANSYTNPVNIYITNNLPGNVEFISATENGKFDDVTRIVTWVLMSIPEGESGNVEVTLKINNNAPTFFKNDAIVQIGDDEPKHLNMSMPLID